MMKKKENNKKRKIIIGISIILIILLSVSMITTRKLGKIETILKNIAMDTNKVIMMPFTT